VEVGEISSPGYKISEQLLTGEKQRHRIQVKTTPTSSVKPRLCASPRFVGALLVGIKVLRSAHLHEQVLSLRAQHLTTNIVDEVMPYC